MFGDNVTALLARGTRTTSPACASRRCPARCSTAAPTVRVPAGSPARRTADNSGSAARRRHRARLPRSRRRAVVGRVHGRLRRPAQLRRSRTAWRHAAASATTTSPVAPTHDLIFGQLGNDVDPGRRRHRAGVAATKHVGASRTPDGCVASDACGAARHMPELRPRRRSRPDRLVRGRRPTARTTSRAAAATTSSSAASARTTSSAAAPTSSRSSRPRHTDPDGADILFGGAGTHIDRNDNGWHRRPATPIPGPTATPATPTRSSATTASIIRIVGINGVDVEHVGQRRSWRDVRLVQLRRRLRPAGEDRRARRRRCSTTRRAARTSGRTGSSHRTPAAAALGTETQQGCSAIYQYVTDVNGRPVRRTARVHVGGLVGDLRQRRGPRRARRRLHLPRRRQRRRLRRRRRRRDHRRLGQRLDLRRRRPGRRSSATTAASSPAATARPAGPPTGVAVHRERRRHVLQRAAERRHCLPAGRDCPENKSVLCGDFLNQYISTPGQVQTAVINIGGDLKKTVDLTPYNLRPTATGGDEPKFDANNSDDVIFGGLGGEIQPLYPTVMGHLQQRGAAVRPATWRVRRLPARRRRRRRDRRRRGDLERLHPAVRRQRRASSTQRPDAAPTGPVRSTRATCCTSVRTPTPGTTTGPIVTRLGEFALYDEYDPRRTILLNADGTVEQASEPACQWFLNLYSDEGPTMTGCVDVRPERHLPAAERRPQQRRQRRDLRRPRQRLDGRRHRPGHDVRRLGQRPAQRRRRHDDRRHRRLRRPEGHARSSRARTTRPTRIRSTRTAPSAAPASTS